MGEYHSDMIYIKYKVPIFHRSGHHHLSAPCLLWFQFNILPAHSEIPLLKVLLPTFKGSQIGLESRTGHKPKIFYDDNQNKFNDHGDCYGGGEGGGGSTNLNNCRALFAVKTVVVTKIC